MRPKVLLFIGSVIALVLALLIFWQQRQSDTSPKNEAQNGQVAPAISNVPAILKETNNSPYANVSSSASQLSVVNDRTKTNKIREFMESQNKPIEFYGQVVDQDGRPLAGASVKGEALHVKVIAPTAWGDEDQVIPIEKETDPMGRFEIQGISGRAVELESVQKNGYEAEPVKRAWGTTEGTFEIPVIFKMWSTNIHEQLITGEKKFSIIPDGRLYVIDLTKGAIAEFGTGDLKVWIKRPEQVTYGQRYDWSCEVDVVNGGLIEEPVGSVMYVAPTEGYVSSFQFEQKIDSGWGDSTGAKPFYVILNNGREYARITIELYAYYNDQIPGLIRLSYAINPSGSRILKP
ncbi:MAG TPA: hypothetical protein VJT54_04230 [Verrucomicrobiae bacterium]|nr:hypothetical protein [Verrucomicrobiae bacterium]